MKKLLTLIVSIGFVLGSFGQTITNAEYFIDTDPGVGNGTNIPILHTVELLDWYTGGPEPKILKGI